MAKPDRDTDDIFEEARRALREEGWTTAVERAAWLLRKAKDSSVTDALVSAWKENESLLRLQETARALTTELNLDKLLNDIIDAAIEVVGAERGVLMLAADGPRPAANGPAVVAARPKTARTRNGAELESSLQIKAARNMGHTALDEAEMKISRSVAERAYRKEEAILTTNAEEDDRFKGSQSIMEYRLRSILCAPLKTKGGVIGVLYMDNRSVKGMFDEGHQRLLELFAGQAAVAVENARLHSELLAGKKALEEKHEEVEVLNLQLARRVERQEVELVEVRRVLDESRRDLGLKYNYDRIIGKSRKMQEIFRLLDRTTDTSVPVLIVGESGTGKELVAKAIHYNGPRKNAAFAAENVSAISETLLESELFGHVKGAFTGSTSDKMGLFEIADGGTLFLDEIGDMSKSLQAKLLRALQEGEIRRVGGKDTIKVDVRIISATNRDLEEMVKSGEFRQDLYWRLNVIKIPLPPLRERREDIPLLVDHFLESFAERGMGPKRTISEAALGVIMACDWPGNVRELENEMARAVVLSDGLITPEVLSDRRKSGVGGAVVPEPPQSNKPLKDLIDEMERQIIYRTLEQTGGNKSATAKELGLSRDGLRKKLIRYGLDGDKG